MVEVCQSGGSAARTSTWIDPSASPDLLVVAEFEDD